MTCSCTSSKLKECSCKLFGYPAKGNLDFPAQFVFGNLGQTGRTDPYYFRRPQEKGILYKIFELFYNKCAAYNLRYCPLRKAVDQDKYLTNAAKDLVILTFFLVANFIVLVIILTRTVLHILAVFKITGHSIKKYITTYADSSIPINLSDTSTLTGHDFTPPRLM